MYIRALCGLSSQGQFSLLVFLSVCKLALLIALSFPVRVWVFIVYRMSPPSFLFHPLLFHGSAS